MAIIKCKMCGGDIEISQDKTFGVCECCGSTMTFPKVDDDQRAAAFNRGNYFRRIGEFDKALVVYEHIVEEDNTDAEAHWCSALCRYGIEYVEDPTSHEYLPTCHRASFDNFLEDVDYQAALQYSDGITKRQYEKDAAKIAEVQHGILATCQNEQPFDVFICYKESDENGNRTKDSTLAQEIYYQLTDQGRRVFFARITLEDKVGTEYEPYIFAALNSAKVMVVVGTKPEYFNAVWVKNEWSRFLAMMKKDRSKLLLPCYRDMDPYDLPEALSVLQSYDMSKIGFIQDLTRGISKVLDAGKQPAAAAKETVVLQNVANTNVTAQIKRGNMALADGEWEQAKTFFNQALDMDAECAEAYLGLALREAHCANLDALQKKQLDTIDATQGSTITVPFKDELQNVLSNTRTVYCSKIRELCDLPDMLSDMEKIFSYTNFQMQSALEEKQEAWKEVQKYYTNDRNMSKALRFAKGETSQLCKEHLSGLHKAAEKLFENQKQREQAEADKKKALFTTFLSSATQRADKILEANREKLEQTYQSAQEEQGKAQTAEDWEKAAYLYASLGKYRDAAVQHEKCQDAMRAIEGQKRKAQIRVLIIACVVLVLICIAFTAAPIVISAFKYRKADQLYAAQDYQQAAEIYYDLGDYEDAHSRYKDATYLAFGQELISMQDMDAAESRLKDMLKEIGRGMTKDEPYYKYCEARRQYNRATNLNGRRLTIPLFEQAGILDSDEYIAGIETEREEAYQQALAMFQDASVPFNTVEEAFASVGDYKDAPVYRKRLKSYISFAQDSSFIETVCAIAPNGNYLIVHKTQVSRGDYWFADKYEDGVVTNGIPLKVSDEEVHQIVEDFAATYSAEIETYTEADKEAMKQRV